MATHGDIPDDFMHRMPDPVTYYARELGRDLVPDEFGWVEVPCPLRRGPYAPLHPMRVDLKTGNFSCPRCGRGDLLLFHMLRHTMRLKAAILELIGEHDHDNASRP